MEKFDILDNPERIKETDKNGMLGVVAQTPEMFADAIVLSRAVSLKKIKKVRHVIVSGMGGSAIAGDVASDFLLGQSKVPICVNRGYRIPEFASSETLFLVLSYSGNTEETLSALKEAEARKAKIVCVASGGRLKEIAEDKGYPLYFVPDGFAPRAALPYLLVPVLKSLEEVGVFSGMSDMLEDSIALLQRLRSEYGPDKPLRGNLVKQLARRLEGKVPMLCGSAGTTQAAALRIKNQFNENSKLTALLSFFPEMNHNEIVNLFALKRDAHNFSLIFLRDEGDVERVKKRMEITKSMIGNQLGGVNEIWSQGKNPLARILSLIYFGDFLSVYLAILRGVDPSPIEAIDRFKRELLR